MNDTVLIRSLTETDIPAIIQVFRETVLTVNSKDYSPEQVSAWADAGNNPGKWKTRISSQYFIGVLTTSPGATAVLAGFASLAPDGCLDILYVNRNWQGRGLASVLFNKLFAYARENGLSRLYADVSITAKPFFLHKGFEVKETQQKFIGDTSFINYSMELIM